MSLIRSLGGSILITSRAGNASRSRVRKSNEQNNNYRAGQHKEPATAARNDGNIAEYPPYNTVVRMIHYTLLLCAKSIFSAPIAVRNLGNCWLTFVTYYRSARIRM